MKWYVCHSQIICSRISQGINVKPGALMVGVRGFLAKITMAAETVGICTWKGIWNLTLLLFQALYFIRNPLATICLHTIYTSVSGVEGGEEITCPSWVTSHRLVFSFLALVGFVTESQLRAPPCAIILICLLQCWEIYVGFWSPFGFKKVGSFLNLVHPCNNWKKSITSEYHKIRNLYFVSKVPYITLTGGSGGPYYSYYGAGGGGVMINGEGPTSTTYGRGQVIILILLHSWVLRMNTIVLYC